MKNVLNFCYSWMAHTILCFRSIIIIFYTWQRRPNILYVVQQPGFRKSSPGNAIRFETCAWYFTETLHCRRVKSVYGFVNSNLDSSEQEVFGLYNFIDLFIRFTCIEHHVIMVKRILYYSFHFKFKEGWLIMECFCARWWSFLSTIWRPRSFRLFSEVTQGIRFSPELQK